MTQTHLAFLQPLHMVLASPATSTEQLQHSSEDASFQGTALSLARGYWAM